MKSNEFLLAKCREMRLRLLQLTYSVGRSGAHIGGALSTVEALIILYHNFMNISVQNCQIPTRDRFILSKGHSAMALYCILEQIGLMPKEEVDQFEINGSPYYAHASRNLARGIEFSGGSLSLGLSYAIGVAVSCKKNNYNNHIYCMVGDGECDEGLVWEALMSAANFKLDNLTVIVDNNGFQSDGIKTDIMNHYSLSEKFKAFGFNVNEVDGHNLDALNQAFTNKSEHLPNVIISNTLKGKGVSFMAGNGIWHHGSLDSNQYQLAISEQ